jgi:hypothetical protein
LFAAAAASGAFWFAGLPISLRSASSSKLVKT